MGVNSLPKTVTRQRRGCDLNPGPSATESSTLTTRLPSHPATTLINLFTYLVHRKLLSRPSVPHLGLGLKFSLRLGLLVHVYCCVFCVATVSQ